MLGAAANTTLRCAARCACCAELHCIAAGRDRLLLTDTCTTQSTTTPRLAEERKKWRKDHPPGFVARPTTAADGSTDLMRWDCKVPGPDDTCWAGGVYPVTLKFPESFPAEPPLC